MPKPLTFCLPFFFSGPFALARDGGPNSDALPELKLFGALRFRCVALTQPLVSTGQSADRAALAGSPVERRQSLNTRKPVSVREVGRGTI
jgi:hypothetical protein